ncbi:MAG: dTDP-glucose pyrophosphorylase [Nitrospira sp.]|nr:MAG: dTDP-glucose pyrophosphorylase [Nitrospira sp.]
MRGRIAQQKEVVAVLPAAGRSLRLAPLPCSKELLPVGFGSIPGIQGTRPKVVSHYLLECLRKAGVRKGYVVIRQGKWDIPAYWGDGKILGMDLAYVVIEGSSGPPDTIDRAYPFIKDKVVAFGFPDIIFRPRDVFAKLLARLNRPGVDVVLALFPAHDPKAMDMIDIDENLRIRSIHLKPKTTGLRYAWLCAAWTPVFTEFLHQFLSGVKGGKGAGVIGNRKIDPQGDIPVGLVLKKAVQAKLTVEGVMFPSGSYIDVGLPQHLVKAVKDHSRLWRGVERVEVKR